MRARVCECLIHHERLAYFIFPLGMQNTFQIDSHCKKSVQSNCSLEMISEKNRAGEIFPKCQPIVPISVRLHTITTMEARLPHPPKKRKEQFSSAHYISRTGSGRKPCRGLKTADLLHKLSGSIMPTGILECLSRTCQLCCDLLADACAGGGGTPPQNMLGSGWGPLRPSFPRVPWGIFVA